ncbi:MAG: DUF4384 domain-containing protein [Candidatus Zixiibacteriota bacterium]|nr:MAG: DUF4384 domain-containing protein [candidate division Zixibacteria bacterium]
MKRITTRIIGLTALAAVILSPVVKAVDEEFQGEYYDQVKIDRYLDVDIWTNHSDNEFYEGDNIVLHFRTNRDAFVAIYSVDSRGHVNLLFPTSPADDNYVRGGATYQIPDGADDFDLVVTGPDGVENIQAIASRERFPIPDWYPTSGLICDWDDRLEFMDYVNAEYFVRYGGQRFAFDRTALYIYEWEPDYFHPIYYPAYPSWSVCGNVYIDYPYGGTVYVNGIYWGVIPLYIPRIYVGWHTFTIYDYYGYCWEYPVHITRYNTVVLDRTIIVTSPTVVSKYKDVRLVGYRDPVLHGYPAFKTKQVVTAKPSAKSAKAAKAGDLKLNKKFVRGATKVVKTDRGFETVGGIHKAANKGKAVGNTGGTKSYQATKSKGTTSRVGKSSGSTPSKLRTSQKSSKAVQSQGGSKVKSGGPTKSSSGYYQKKSGSRTPAKSSKVSPRRSTRAPSPSKSKSVSPGKSSPQTKSSGTKSSPKSSSSSKKSSPEKKSPKTSDKGKTRR